MKKSIYRNSIIVIIASILIFTFSQSASAAQIRLAWNANTESDLSGYKVYYGTTSKSYIKSIDIGNEINYTLTALTSGQTYFIVVTAYDNLYYESGFSLEVNGVAVGIEPPPPAPPPTILPTPISEPTPTPIVEPTPTPTPSPVAEPVTIGQVYVAVSEITSDGEAIGNVKKYELTNNTNGSTVVQIVDANNTPVLDSNNQIKESSTSAWSISAVWKKVGKGKGGVGEVLLSRTKPRNIFTNIETTNSTNLMNESNEFAIENEKLTPEMLGLATGDTSEREKLIQYVHGFDAYAKDKEKASLQKRKWILGSIVNSRPLVIPYVRSKKVIFVGANDGMLHAFDDRTGEELWGFIPYELLGRLKELPQGNGLKYFVDGSPKAYITKSQKIIVFGLRRGGNNYYALDVTNPESPKFLWKIGPETTGFSEIGQTWSDPQFGKIKYGTGAKAVCIIGGGYDENQDRKTPAAEDKKGRAVYVVDLLTGVQIWRWDSKRDPNMKHSIPSTIACADVNGDGYIDRLYVGDMGGKLWSFDLKGSDPNGWSGGRVVFNSNRGFAGSGKQKIFSKPDVTLEKGGEMVLFGTGDREHPHEKIGVDKFYAFLDKGQGTALSEDNLADVTKDFATVQNLANKEGWFISMEDKGEKVLAPPVVAFGVVYFTTFTPSLDGDGLARIYALNYRVGNPIFNLNSENDQGGPKIDLSDRSKIIGTGIPSGTVISALGGRPIAYTGFAGGLYSTHLKGHSTIIPISWKEVSKKK
jgi:type IV pilus assembly protein PilY1